MDYRQFVEDYKEAFSEKATLPIAFWHSDTPVAVPEPVNGCFFPAFEKVRDGQPVCFDSTTMKCGGGKFYCGLAAMPESDILSGLVSWAYYDNSSDNAVCTPWGSGCSTTIRQVIIEEENLGSRCFIGLFDPSVRPRVRANELMFGIPKNRLEEMTTFMRDTCLFNGAAWPKVKERIKDGSTKY